MMFAVSTEYKSLRYAIDTALANDEPDSLYYHFRDLIYDSMKQGRITVFEMSDLDRLLSLWWEGRGDLDYDFKGECGT